MFVAHQATFAQTTTMQPPSTVGAPPPVSVVTPDADDDAVPQPAEPDFRLINVPTTLRLPLHKSNFQLTHRFNGNLRRGDFGDQASNLFGLDEGAVIGIEYRVAVLSRVEAAAYRSAVDKTFQFYGKYDPVHEGRSSPISLSGLV